MVATHGVAADGHVEPSCDGATDSADWGGRLRGMFTVALFILKAARGWGELKGWSVDGSRAVETCVKDFTTKVPRV